MRLDLCVGVWTQTSSNYRHGYNFITVYLQPSLATCSKRVGDRQLRMLAPTADKYAHPLWEDIHVQLVAIKGVWAVSTGYDHDFISISSLCQLGQMVSFYALMTMMTLLL